MPTAARARVTLSNAALTVRQFRGAMGAVMGLCGPARERHTEVSVIHAPSAGAPSAALMELILDAARVAIHTNLEALSSRSSAAVSKVVNVWPGEHYRFLAALVRSAGVRRAVEVGTFQGFGALVLQVGGAQVTTFDIVRWNEIPQTAIRAGDIHGGLRQEVADLADPHQYAKHRDSLLSADLIFVDGPKDGTFETLFLPRVVEDFRGSGKILVVDDIRLPVMLSLWDRLAIDKADATSLGHWSGTGVALL